MARFVLIVVWAAVGVGFGEVRLRDLRLAGDAGIVGGTVLRLTPARGNRGGAAWMAEKQTVGSGFDTNFEFRLTRQGGLGRGADGFAFVLQNAGPAALGGRGSAGGFAVADANFHPGEAGIPWSIAIFFDTYRNEEEGDPSGNYVAIRTNGRPAEMRWPAERLAFTPELRVRLKDGKVHRARILYQPPVVSVYLDGDEAPVLETAVDLSIVADGEGRAWVGFTASTGGGWENHDILNWTFGASEVSSSISVVSSQITFLMSACLPGRNLCTPERAVVEPRGDGWHVILPANLEWGASVPNPEGRAVEVRNAHGVACWDSQARGRSGCGGPAGNGRGGAGFLVAGEAAGKLVMKTGEGRTWFSVNGRGFGGNEGFYEFEVGMR